MISADPDEPVLIETAGPDQCDVCGAFCEEENLNEDGECDRALAWDD